MAQVEGKMNTCDRCGKTVFVSNSQEASESSNWREIRRYTVDGTAVTRFVCQECNAQYKEQFAKEDTSFNKFMSATEE